MTSKEQKELMIFFIEHNKVTKNKVKEVTHDRIMYTIREMKKEKHMKIMTVERKNIKYQVDVSMPTAHLETAKILFNCVLSRNNAKFMKLDIGNFYFINPIKDYECLQINTSTIPEDIKNAICIKFRTKAGCM